MVENPFGECSDDTSAWFNVVFRVPACDLRKHLPEDWKHLWNEVKKEVVTDSVSMGFNSGNATCTLQGTVGLVRAILSGLGPVRTDGASLLRNVNVHINATVGPETDVVELLLAVIPEIRVKNVCDAFSVSESCKACGAVSYSQRLPPQFTGLCDVKYFGKYFPGGLLISEKALSAFPKGSVEVRALRQSKRVHQLIVGESCEIDLKRSRLRVEDPCRACGRPSHTYINDLCSGPLVGDESPEVRVFDDGRPLYIKRESIPQAPLFLGDIWLGREGGPKRQQRKRKDGSVFAFSRSFDRRPLLFANGRIFEKLVRMGMDPTVSASPVILR